MSLESRGEKKYLIKIFLGYDPITGKRLQRAETFYGVKREAQKRERELMQERDTSKFIKPAKLVTDNLFEDYLSSLFIRDNTRHTYKNKYETYFQKELGKVEIAKVSSTLIQNIYRVMLDRGISATTVRHTHAILKSTFKFAVEKRYIHENPFEKVKLPKQTQPKINYLDLVETKSFIEAADGERYGPAFIFQIHTGQRNEELMALTWSDVDFRRKTLNINKACLWVRSSFKKFQSTKSKNSNRVIPLADDQVEFLQHHLTNQQGEINKRRTKGLSYNSELNLIFPKQDGEPPSICAPRLAFKKILKKSKVSNQKLRWYDLRHTHATLMLDQGVVVTLLAQRMGHSVEILLRHYASYLASRDHEASEMFATLIPLGKDRKTKRDIHIIEPPVEIQRRWLEESLGEEHYLESSRFELERCTNLVH